MALIVTHIDTSTGRVILEDGTEMQLVMAANGALGARPVRDQDIAGSIDQEGGPKNHFDTSGLDQPV